MKTWEQYQAYYEKYGRLITDIGSRSNTLTDRGLKSRYERYVKSEDRKQEKKSNKQPVTYGHFIIGKSCRLITLLQTNPICFLSKKTPLGNLVDLKNRAPLFLLEKTDPAHVFSRASNKFMHELPENIIPLNRYSHSMIDTWKHPIFGTPITDEERDEFWCIMVGYSQYQELERISKEKRL